MFLIWGIIMTRTILIMIIILSIIIINGIKCNLTKVSNEELVFSVLGVCEHSAWSASRPVALWHFPVLCYFVGHESRAF